MNPQSGLNGPPEKRSLKETFAIIGRIGKIIMRWKKYFYILIAVILLTIMCQLAVPVLVEKCIDCLIYRDESGEYLRMLWHILTTLIVLFIFNSFIEYFKNISAMKLSENMSRFLRSRLFEKIVRAPLSVLDKHSYGDLMSRLTNDSQRISTVAQVLEQFLSKTIVIFGCAIFMLLKNPKLAMISIITAIVTTIISTIISGKMRNFFLGQTIKLGEVNGHIEETMKNFRTMEMTGMENYSSNRMMQKSTEYTNICIRSSMFSGIINPIMLILGNASFLITIVVGGRLAIKGIVTLGVLQAVIMYSKQFMDAVYSFGNVLIQVQSFLASAERVFEITDLGEENRGTHTTLKKEEKRTDIPDGIYFENINFAYESEKVIDDVTLNAPRGKSTALVGSTGAGKTTLISLLLKFYDNYEGNIYLNGTDIRDMSLADTRDMITVVLQDSKLMEGTITENILYGSKVNKEDAPKIVRDITNRMGITDMIEALPDGFKTRTDDEDETISEGLRQIIGLARALVKEPKILILDEALSAVDKPTEEKIKKNILSGDKDITMLVIAHRLDTITNSDSICVLKHGKLVEQGTHDELTALGKEYKRLYNREISGKEN